MSRSTSFVQAQQLGLPTMSPAVSRLVNDCRAKQLAFCFVIQGPDGSRRYADPETSEAKNPLRMSIVVDERGCYLGKFWG